MSQPTHRHIPGSLAYWRDLARARDLDVYRLREQLAAAVDRAETQRRHPDDDWQVLDELLNELRRMSGGTS
jgi:hypothetical protein